MLNNLTIRVRIASAIFGLSAGLLALMALAVYFSFARQLNHNLDDVLRLRAAANQGLLDTTKSPPQLSLVTDPGADLATGAALLRLYSSNGTVLSDGSPAVGIAAEEVALASEAAQNGGPIIRSMQDAGEGYRVVAEPVMREQSVEAVLVTGLELSGVTEPLEILRIALLVATSLTSIALGAGAFVIARQSLRPIALITTTAKRIAGGDLDDRLRGIKTKDEVGELAETFNEMIGQLAATIERERRFTADASHELRTPITAIGTSIEVTLAQQRTAEEYQHALNSIHGQTSRLANLTRQLLLLSRLDAGQLESEFEQLDLAELVAAIAMSFSENRPEAKLSVVGQDHSLPVLGDLELLARAFTNVLDNARVHAGPNPSIAIQMDATGEGQARVTISDDGPGLPKNLEDGAFQRFRRGGGSDGASGTGLGLAIVAAIVRAHGGTVKNVSSSDAGAIFEFTFPIHP